MALPRDPLAGILDRWTPVIGLEVHAQLRTRTKLFCGCSTTFGAHPNSNVCPVCLGHPGVLPVLNAEAVRMAVMTGLGLHSEITQGSVFARKNYFYPDLPKGYQVSQFERPICSGGWLAIETEAGPMKASIVRAHLEEDAGKSIHDPARGVSLVDFNRAGVPLLEIVGRPDLRHPDQAVAYLKELRNLLRYLGVCDGNLEEGSFRCDANVSVMPRGSETFGTRTEIKNLNSFRNVGRALTYEIRRQVRILEGGGSLAMETRLFDADKGQTASMRSKEGSSDYRYFPDPDLLPVQLPEGFVEAVRAALPELPEAARARLRGLGLRPTDVAILTEDQPLCGYFEAVVAAGAEPVAASNWIQTEVLGRLAYDKIPIDLCPVPPAALARLLALQAAGRATGKMAKAIFSAMWTEGTDPDAALEAMGEAVSDESAVRALCQEVIEAFPGEVDQVREGKTKVLGFLMGQVMKKSRGKADPRLASALLRELIGAP